MHKLVILALVAAGQLLLTKPATAITFNFSWRSDAERLTVTPAVSGVVYRATGTVELINVMPGESFTKDNVSNLNITITDGTLTNNIDKSHVQVFDFSLSKDNKFTLRQIASSKMYFSNNIFVIETFDFNSNAALPFHLIHISFYY